jgi:hypothetical protein
MPDAVTERAQQAWRERLQTRLAPYGLDPDWPAMDAAVRLASLVWCLITVGWFLPGSVADRRAGGDGINSPQLRAVVQYRLRLLATSDMPELVASRDLARQLSAALTSVWQSQQLPFAPAFQLGQTRSQRTAQPSISDSPTRGPPGHLLGVEGKRDVLPRAIVMFAGRTQSRTQSDRDPNPGDPASGDRRPA